MAKAKKLKSGNWRVLIFDSTDDNGKRHYKSFTAVTKKEAEYMAASYKMNEKDSKNQTMFGVALENYISGRKNILSPTTIKYYKMLQKGRLHPLLNVSIADLSQSKIQNFINEISSELSPKSIRNIHGLISGVIHECDPGKALNTILPEKRKPDINIPSDEDIKKLLDHIKDTSMEIPVLLAAFGPMRRGEICALRAEDIDGNCIHIRSALALNEHNKWVRKAPKTASSNRTIVFPDFVIEKLPRSGPVCSVSPHQITDAFPKILKKAGIKKFRFHDLRHYSASIQHAMGIPDKYVMQRGGWATDGVLKTVYQHTLEEQGKEVNSRINAYFSEMQHKMQHKK